MHGRSNGVSESDPARRLRWRAPEGCGNTRYMDSELRCGSATQLEFLGYDSVTKTAEALVPRTATRGALSKSEISGCAVGSPAACAVVSLGASLVNLEPAPDEVPAEGAYSQGTRRCHGLMLPRDSEYGGWRTLPPKVLLRALNGFTSRFPERLGNGVAPCICSSRIASPALNTRSAPAFLSSDVPFLRFRLPKRVLEFHWVTSSHDSCTVAHFGAFLHSS